MEKFKKDQNQKGFTLIEFMVVIALIGLGLVLVVTQFGQANAANQSQTSVRNISSLVSGITGLKDVRNGYAGLSTSVLLQTNGVPENMKGTANAITNIYGGNVEVGVDGADTTNGTFAITYAGVTQEACTEVVAKLLSARNTTINSIQVDSAGTAPTVAAGVITMGGVAITTLAGIPANCTATANTLYINGN